jgi:hypothetical protein
MTAASVSSRSAAGGRPSPVAIVARLTPPAARPAPALLRQRHAVGERVVEDDADRAALPGDEGQPGAGFANAHRHGDRAQPLQGEEHEQELRPVREQHQHPIAGADAAGGEAGREAIGLRAGLGIAPALVLVDDRLVVVARARSLEHLQHSRAVQ